MKKIKRIWEIIFTKISIGYIKFVYKTSKVIKTGRVDLLEQENLPGVVIGFWHGDSYCAFPVLRNTGTYVITTINKRGDYIENIGKSFRYNVIRVPDESRGENHLFKIRKEINGIKKNGLAFALDGPLGPYHVPKKFVLILALLTKRKVVPASFNVKRKIRLVKRWDKYVVPLPFNKIEIYIHEPIEIKKDEIDDIGKKITEDMEKIFLKKE